MKRTRIIVADDHTLVADAIKRLLEPEFEVVGVFSDGKELVEAAPELSPEVVILDINMPTMNGLTAGPRLKEILPKVKLIYLTMHQEPETAGEAFRNGASGYVLKTSAASELLKAIHLVLRGGNFVTPSLSEGMLGSFVQNFKRMPSTRKLTLRQKEVLNLLAEGHSMKQVGNVLNITARTVAFHKYTIMDNLNIRSNAELTTYAMKNQSSA